MDLFMIKVSFRCVTVEPNVYSETLTTIVLSWGDNGVRHPDWTSPTKVLRTVVESSEGSSGGPPESNTMRGGF